MNPTVTVVDYGVGNLFSVRGALEYCGTNVKMSRSPEEIETADRLLLPGVGAFHRSMEDMRTFDLVEPVRRFFKKGKPLFGICLGMQMLFDQSEEFGLHEGLGLIPGIVSAIPAEGKNGEPHRIPHVGWAELASTGIEDWDDTLLKGVETGSSVYFAHSFRAIPANPSNLIATCDYDGDWISAVVRLDNAVGCQFHPEISGEIGINILRNYLELN